MKRDVSIELRYKRGETMNAIGESLGLSRQRIKQILEQRGVKGEDGGRYVQELKALEAWEAAYIAGFADGEGHFSCSKRMRSPKFMVGLHISQVDLRPLEWLKERITGSLFIWRVMGRRPIGRYCLGQGKAFDFFIPQIIPYLRVKRERAQKCWELGHAMRIKGRRRSTPEQEAKFLRLYTEAKSYSLDSVAL